MATQLFTSTNQQALAYAPQSHVETLCDGSLAVVAFDGTNINLYRVTSPASSPSAASVKTFTPSGTTTFPSSLYVLNNGTASSDVWLVYGSSNSGSNTLSVAHGAFTAAGATWSWDNTGTSLGASTVSLVVPSIVWTGAYLIVGSRADISNTYEYGIWRTSTKSGASGWSSVMQLSSTTSASTHYFGALLHDATNGCTLAVYSIQGDTVKARVIADTSDPATLANWSGEVSLSGTVGVGAANVTAVLDAANKNLHVAWCNSSASPNPSYVKSTYTTTSVSAGTSFTISGGGGTAAIAPALGLDVGSPNPTVYLFWGGAAAGAASDVSYVTITSPYASGNVSGVTNLTNASASDNNYPHVPQAAPFSGYVPLVYAKTASSPYAIMLDTSVSAASGPASGAATIHGQGKLLAAGVQVFSGGAVVHGQGDIAPASGAQVVSGAATIKGHGDVAPAAGVQVVSGAATIHGHGQLGPASGYEVITSAGAVVQGHGKLLASGNSAGLGAATIQGAGRLVAAGVQALSGAATIHGQGRVSPAGPGAQVNTGAATIKGHGQISPAGPGAQVNTGAATVKGHGQVNPAAGVEVVTGGAIIQGHGKLTASAFTPGTGIGDISVTTDAVSWPNSSSGAGSGTETLVTYKDSTGSGWAQGLWPKYGGGPITAIYEEDNNTQSANQTSDTTTSSDGHIHWLEQSSGGAFAGSEDVAFNNAGGLTEQAPAGTPFRYYAKVVANGVDANGFQWTMWACVYPGDPGMTFYRFDLTNPSGSAKTLAGSDSLEIALLGGLQQADSTWAPANGGYGTLAGSNVTGWPATLTSVEPDYVYITPNTAAAGIKLGQATIKKTSLSGLGWSNLQIQYLQATSRLKVKVQGAYTSFPAGATQTVYLLGVLRRSLSATDVRAIAADYLRPGAPTVSGGAYTGWSDDEGLYVFAPSAANGQVSVTLDMTPSGVTTRFKPRYKFTNWTDASAPILTWGGATLVAGQDFRWTHDATNNVLYVQVYSDVVSSGAVSGQRNNAALLVAPGAVSGAATIHGAGRLVAAGVQALSGGAVVHGQGRLSPAGPGAQVVSGAATVVGHGRLTVSGVQVITGAAVVQGRGQLSPAGPGVEVFTGGATIHGHGVVAPAGPGVQVVVSHPASVHGQGEVVASGRVTGAGGATVQGGGRLFASGYQVIVCHPVSIHGHGQVLATGGAGYTGAATIVGHGQVAPAGPGMEVVIAAAMVMGRGSLRATGGVPGFSLATLRGPGAGGSTNESPVIIVVTNDLGVVSVIRTV